MSQLLEGPCKIICNVDSVPKDHIPFKTVALLGAKADEVSWVKPTSLLCHVPDWKVRRSSPSLKKNLLKKPDRDATILFTTQGTYKSPITAYICKERKLNPDPTFRLGTLKPPVLSGTHDASRNAALPQQGGKYQRLLKTLFFVLHLLGRLNFPVGSSCPFPFVRKKPWPFKEQKQHHCVIYVTKCHQKKVNFKY